MCKPLNGLLSDLTCISIHSTGVHSCSNHWNWIYGARSSFKCRLQNNHLDSFQDNCLDLLLEGLWQWQRRCLCNDRLSKLFCHNKNILSINIYVKFISTAFSYRDHATWCILCFISHTDRTCYDKVRTNDGLLTCQSQAFPDRKVKQWLKYNR